jgi:protein gp37
MSAGTKIEWADHTINFWWGCTFARYVDGSLRDECLHCYAKTLAALFSRKRATWGADGKRWIRHEAARRELYALDLDARERGVRERVFVNSMSDTFEDREDLREARERLWDACRNVSNIDMLLLTKRPGNVRRMVPPDWLTNWPAHVWLGTTAGTQKAADENIPLLLDAPARVRFVSCEPMLGPVDLTVPAFNGADSFGRLEGLHWAIIGGESGPGARDFDVEAAWDLVRQCQDAGVATFVKQLGARPVTGNANVLDWPDDTVFISHGNGAASARVKLRDAKGGDIDEFPMELRLRQFPEVVA